MFVLLEHDTRDEAARGRRPGAGEVHWDLLIEVPGQERLATWRLAENPIEGSAEIAAERIGDHRRAYLDYVGELSGGRGSVRRLDRGASVLEEYSEHRVTADLEGEHLRGRYEVARLASGALLLRRASSGSRPLVSD
jgi:hypothetical protein